MKIKIISERKVNPQNITFPLNNKEFSNIKQPDTNSVKLKEKQLHVFVHEKAYQSIWQHSCLDIENELGGALIGFYGQDGDKSFLIITDVLNQPMEYHLHPTMLRFTRQFYEDLEAYIEDIYKQYPSILRLGLYHTHPNYGVFLSRTDAETFKGVFKDIFQIAMVVDPVKKEDGVFFWQDGDISKRAAHYIYTSSNLQFSPHLASTKNAILAKYNPQFNTYVKRKETVVEQAKEETKKPKILEKIKLFFSPKKAEKVEVEVIKKPLKISPLDYIPKMSPLYDMRYKNRQVKLYKYLRPMKRGDIKMHEYPFMVFLHKLIIEQIKMKVRMGEESIALLYGDACYDKHKALYFLYINKILFHNNGQEHTYTTETISNLWKEGHQKSIKPIGWIYVRPKRIRSIYHFYDMHQDICNKAQHLGILIHTQEDEEYPLDLQNLGLIAYDFKSEQPFDYFENFFIYKKPY